MLVEKVKEAGYCSHCSSELAKGANFCGVCGKNVKPAAENVELISESGLPRITFRSAINRAALNGLNFSGRATRAEFWWWMLFAAGFGMVWGLVSVIVLSVAPYSLESQLYTYIPYIPIYVIALSLTVRRLHDTGRTGWWCLGSFNYPLLTLNSYVAYDIPDTYMTILSLPLIGAFVWLFICCCRQGQLGPNKYGPDPRTTPR